MRVPDFSRPILKGKWTSWILCFYTKYLKKRYYRIIESLIKKILIYKNNSKNSTLQKTIRSAIYNTTDENKILFSNNKDIKYLLGSSDWISKKLFIDNSFDYRILTKAIKLQKKYCIILFKISNIC